MAICRPRLVWGVGILDWFFTALLISWLAAFQWAVLALLFKKAGK